MKQYNYLTNRYLIALLIVLFSFCHFIFIHSIEPLLPSPTAFEWPAVDMMVYFERALDNHFLLNDFFTNTSHESSPRQTFGESIIFIAKLLQAHYYTIFFGLKAFLKIFLPSVLYIFLCSIRLGFENDDKKIMLKDILLAPWAFIAGTWWAAATFTVANWRPLPIWAAPQSLGLFLALMGGILLLSQNKFKNILAAILLFAGTLIHPAMALFVVAFLILSANTVRESVRIGIISIISVFLGTFILQHYFSDPYKLSNVLFIKNYVIEPYIHRGHYAPESFGSYGSWPWYSVAKMISSILALGFIISMLFKQYRLALLSSVYLASYLLAIGLQIFFINDMPSRTMATLGPIRFTQFGFYMLALIVSGILTVITCHYSQQLLMRYNLSIKSYKMLSSYILSGLCLTAASFLWMDNPKDILVKHHLEMYQWISQHTKSTDTFAVPLSDSELFISIPIVAHRPVYYANAIAFADKHLEENTIRKNFIYGSHTEWREGGPGGYYCHILTGQRLQQAAKAYPLQWAIMPNDCLTDKRYSNLKVVFSDKSLSILKV